MIPLLNRSTRDAILQLVLSLSVAAAPATAATVSHQATFPLSPYLNSGSHTYAPLSIPKFNTAGECLTSVCVRVDAGLNGSVGFENYQAYPVVVTVQYTGSVTLQRPDLSTILTVQPATTINDNLPVFDNVLDYGGLSGRTYPSVGATQSDSLCITTGPDLALFSGAGNITLPGYGTDLASQIGASSWSIGVRTYATVTVRYTSTPCATPNRRSTWGRVRTLYR